jgi:hypothetical protein
MSNLDRQMLQLYAMSGMGGMFSRKKPAKKTKKKKLDNWFEGKTCPELKTLCKAAKLTVSGTKPQLARRLMEHEFTAKLEYQSLPCLKETCRERLLQVSGSKYDLMLQILYAEYQTGTAKRAATEVVTDEATGETTQVIKKKRKTAPTPPRLYEKVQKKIESVRQKKYQTHYGSKNHSEAVYGLMGTLIDEEVLDNTGIITNDPILALELAKAPFQALYDHWSTMERPGYGSYEFSNALNKLDDVLVVILPRLSTEQIEELVCLLESVEACVSGYCIHQEYTGEAGKSKNLIEQVICTVMPDYSKENRGPKRGKCLESDIRTVAWMNGIA